MKFLVAQTSMFAILAALLVAGPLTAHKAYAKDKKNNESDFEKDTDNLSTIQDELKNAQKKLKTDQDACSALKKVKSTNSDPASATVDPLTGDCFSSCKPVSAGGQCPDALFFEGNVHMDVSIYVVDTNTKKKSFVDDNATSGSVTAYFQQAYGDGAHSLCAEMRTVVARFPDCGCANAVDACRYNQIDAKIAECTSDITQDQSDITDLKGQETTLSDRTTGGCDSCGAGYYQRDQTGAEKTATVLGAIFPYFSTGLNGYLYASGQNSYYKSYNNYLQQCVTIGVPCNGPSYAGAGGVGIGIGTGGLGYMGSYMGGGMAYMGSYMGGGIATVGYMGSYPGMGMSGSVLGGVIGGVSGGMMGSYPGAGMVGMMGGYPGVGMAGMMGSYPGAGMVGMMGGYPGAGMVGMMGGYPGAGMVGMMGGYPGMGMSGSVLGGVIGGVSGGMMGSYPGAGMVGMMGGYPGASMGMMGSYPGGMGYGGGGFYLGMPVGGGGFYAGSMVGAYAGGMVGSYTGGMVGAYPGMGMVGSMMGYSGMYGGGSIAGGFVSGITGGYSGLPMGYGGMGSPLGGMGTMGGYNPYSQYGSLYNESMAQQMLAASRSAQSGQDVMLSQQQVYQAQQRYGQTLQSAYSYGGGYAGSSMGSYGGFGIGGVGLGGATYGAAGGGVF